LIEERKIIIYTILLQKNIECVSDSQFWHCYFMETLSRFFDGGVIYGFDEINIEI
jgi:hypothetical protein